MKTLNECMQTVLANAYAFQLKVHNYHWNVAGPNFTEYHNFFGSIYDQVWNDCDKYAEHIRALGEFSPGSFVQFAKLNSIPEATTVPQASKMIFNLTADNNMLRDYLKQARECAEESGEYGLVNFLEDRIDYHDKLNWMLNAFKVA